MTKMLAGQFIKRYKRFFVDVLLPDGSIITAHNPNTGSMKGLLSEGAPVFVTHAPSPKRKLAYTLEAICAEGHWVGTNTSLPNRLIEAAVLRGELPELGGYQTVKREARYDQTGLSRADLFLSDHSEKRPSAYVEMKNVTLKTGKAACFPDSVTERGTKHLNALMAAITRGHRATMVFVVQRTDCDYFRPAHEIDPVYAATLKKAAAFGVEMLAVSVQVSQDSIQIGSRLPVQLF